VKSTGKRAGPIGAMMFCLRSGLNVGAAVEGDGWLDED
jgi:hypothetical protein